MRLIRRLITSNFHDLLILCIPEEYSLDTGNEAELGLLSIVNCSFRLFVTVLKFIPNSIMSLSKPLIPPLTSHHQLQSPCTCHHEEQCWKFAAKGLLRGAITGYALKTAFSVALSLTSPKLYKQPIQTLTSIFASQDTLNFAKFLGVLSGGYRGSKFK